MSITDRKIVATFFTNLQSLIGDVCDKRTTDISYVRTMGGRLARDAAAMADDKFTISCVQAMLEEFHKELDDLDPWE